MMKKKSTLQIRSSRMACACAVLAIAGLLACSPAAYAKKKVWDFKKGERHPDWVKGKNCTQWNLGPIGAFGYAQSNSKSTGAKSFLIREVVPDTPADGKLKQHDVILGILSPMTGWKAELDAMPGAIRRDYLLRALGLAITEARKKENGGKLVLTVWRPETEPVPVPKEARSYRYGKPAIARWSVLKKPIKGKEIRVALTLPVAGAFSKTAPWECEKTNVIIDRLAQAILDRGFFDRKGPVGRLPVCLDALGLLATGEEQYIPAVQKYARALAKTHEGKVEERVKTASSFNTWHHAYQNVFLAEYYLATGDKEILRGLTDLAVVMAKGRSGVGTYSHGLSYTRYFGLYGPASAYGAMNQCSITANMGLALTRKAGIRNKAIDDAVAIGTQYLLWYVDAGSIDYGNADAWPLHDDNGKNSQAAVFFDIVGHKRATEYFARTTLASYMGRVQGHTGHFFNGVWGAIGAARGGPKAAAAFAEKTRWYTTLERRPNGDAIFNGPGKYKDFSTAGAQLLFYCQPRKAIYLTGKGGSCIEPFSAAEVKESIDAARFVPFDKDLKHARTFTTKELLAKPGSFSPVVRRQAARVLNERDDNVVKELIAMLKSPNRYARYGACIGLHCAGRQSDEAAQALVRILANEQEKLTLRYFAMKALGPGGQKLKLAKPEHGLGIAANTVGPDMLEIVARYKPKGVVSPETYLLDKLHQRIAQVAFSKVFIGKISKDKLNRVSRSLLEGALRSMIANPLGDAHGNAMHCLMAMDKEQQEAFLPDVYRLAKTPPPAVNGKSRPFAIEVLAKFHFKEAMPLAEGLLDEETHGRYWRRPLAIRIFSQFGPDVLKPYMDKIEKYNKEYSAKGPRYEREMLKTAMQKIEAKRGKTTELKNIDPYLEIDQFKHGATAYGLRAKAGDGRSINLTWLKGRTMPTSGRVFRDGKEIATVDPARLIYVDKNAPPGKVDYRVEFTLPKGDTYSLEATFMGHPEDLKGELGILDVQHGANPVTRMNWRVGDPYRLVFVSSEKTNATSKDLATYYTFVTELAKKAGIGGSWKVFSGAKPHTQTEPEKDPENIPIFLIDGKTLIAGNYSGLGPFLPAPINRTETGQVLEEGLVFTGVPPWGLGNPKRVHVGDPTADRQKWRWLKCDRKNPKERHHVYAISDVLKVKSK